ncbi:hypothetical protein K469DRAFT_544121, partial [Zopfia rhizophila CBS 207.26]
VDTVCINQDNVQEQGHQVQHMATIYKEAERVIVWLEQPTRLISSWILLNRWKRCWTITQPIPGYADTYLEALQRKGLELLLRRSWFKRVWILQEVANAHAAVVVCGTKCVSASIFSLIPRLLGINPEPHCQAVLDIFPGSARKDSWWNEKRDLHTLLMKFGRSEATDTRDIIYALLGISSDACNNDFLRADYSRSVQEVIQETTSFLLSFYQLDQRDLPPWTFPEFLQNLNSLSNVVLKWAVHTDQREMIKLLLERPPSSKKANTNFKNEGAWNSLYWRAKRYRKVIAKQQINRDEDSMNVAVGDEQRWDKAQITKKVVKAAAGNNRSGKDVMTLLLDRRGADVQITK